MKNIINKITYIAIGFIATAALVVPAGVSAATFNNDVLDYDTLRVNNYTENPNTTNAQWGTHTSADTGEAVSFAVYYHNTSDEIARNVRVRLTPQNTGVGTNHTFTARVWADNAPQVVGTATVSLSSNESIQYSNAISWYPNQGTLGDYTLLNGQTGNEIFSQAGLYIGDLAPGWGTQGNVTLTFLVSEAQQGQKPSVTTNSATGIGQANATLNCYVDPNGTTNTTNWFEYGTSNSFGNSTNHYGHGGSASSFNDNVSGLSYNSTYYFRCVAQNQHGTTYGNTLTFNTGSGSGNLLPSVSTYSANGVGETFASLRGHVNPHNTSDTSRWFEWGTNSWSLNNNTTKIGQGSSAGTFNDNVSGLSRNQTYYYRAVAQNSQGTVYGSVQSFTTNGSNNQRAFVSTQNATNIQNSAATLNGYVNPYNTSNTTRWFEYGTTRSLGNRTNTINHGSTATNFNDYVSGLSNNTTYYFRAVARNSQGTSYGSILSFTTGGTVVNNRAPEAITNLAINIGQTSARLNGLAIVTGNQFTNGWFEYGRTQSLGNRTSSEGLGTAPSMSFKYSMFGLSSNTTYYYRAVVQNNNGTDYGDILTFRTNSVIVTPPPSTKVRAVSIEKELENLSNPNGNDVSVEALRGDLVRFTITVENTGDYKLEDVDIKDRVPYYLEFANAEDENTNDPQREVVWFVGDMLPGDREEVTLDMIVTAEAKIDSTIENVAQIESKRLTKTSNEVEIEVVDKTSTLAAATFFGGNGFLPDSLIEWLLLIILIFILIILSRVSYGYLEERKRNKSEITIS
ncbi:hypothetical protein ACFLY0_00220 [Patescibacteria group bacterium]